MVVAAAVIVALVSFLYDWAPMLIPATFINASFTARESKIQVYRQVNTEWAAQANWTPQWLSSHVPTLKDVALLETSTYHYHESRKVIRSSSGGGGKEENKDDLNLHPKESTYSSMETSLFFQTCASAKFAWHSSSLSYYKEKEEKEEKEKDEEDVMVVEKDVLPISRFVVDNDLVSVNSWMGCMNVTTALHRDFSHNMFVQIYGRKEFLLVDASVHLPMHPFTTSSYLHPINSNARKLLFKNKNNNNIQVRRIILSPGDVLYLPPMTYHQVRSLDPISISINVWSRSKEEKTMDHIMYHIPLPFEKEWSTSSFRVYAALMYLEKILASPYDGLNRWMDNRWFNMPTIVTKDQRWFQGLEEGLEEIHRTTMKTMKTMKTKSSLWKKFENRASDVRTFVKTRTKKHQHFHLLWNYADEVLTFACRDCLSEFSDREQGLDDIIRVGLLAYRKLST